jgi:hypothetical protein
MVKKALNTRNRRYKKRRKKNLKTLYFEILIIVILILYNVFSFYSIWNVFQPHPGVFADRPSERITSVWLDDNSFHQPFNKDGMLGLRIWLTNPEKVTEGVVSVRIGEEETGRVIYSQDILVTDIPDSVLTDYIDIVPDDIVFDDDTVYYLELDALSCREKTIKTYVGLTEEKFIVSHSGDDRSFTNKMLCIAFIQQKIPLVFVVWIFITIIMILLFTYIWGSNKKKKVKIKLFELPTSLESKIVIPLLVLIGILGTGIFSFDKMSSNAVDYKDEALIDGYVLEEHSSYSQKFTVEKGGLSEIQVSLSAFFDNTATFVMSVQKGQDEVIATVQSNEVDYIDGAYYSWDVSDIELEEGEEYDFYIFTGFIDIDEEKPVIKRIEYIYGK